MENKFKKHNSCSVKEYYSSHGVPYSIKGFIELEVKDRQNYSLSEIRDWIRRYKVKRDSKMLWVSDKKWIANRYNLDVDKWGAAHLIPENKMTVWTFTSKEGFIIPESCDGDDGYIFVFRSKNVQKA